MELKRLTIGEEIENKNKNLTLKVKEFDYDSGMVLMVKKFKRFMKNEKKSKRKRKKNMRKKHHSFQHASIVKRKDTSNHIVPYSRKQVKNSENLRKIRKPMSHGGILR